MWNLLYLSHNILVHFSITDGMVKEECTIAAYLFQTISTNSTWLLVVMTVDKCIAIVNPLSKHQPRWRPVEYTPCIIGTVFIVSVFCNIPYIFAAKVSFSICNCIYTFYGKHVLLQIDNLLQFNSLLIRLHRSKAVVTKGLMIPSFLNKTSTQNQNQRTYIWAKPALFIRSSPEL